MNAMSNIKIVKISIPLGNLLRQPEKYSNKFSEIFHQKNKNH
jgi:hypothetical protein